MKIAVAGLGYVGLSVATLLSTKYEVYGFDINSFIVDSINNRQSHLKDNDIEDFFKNKRLNLVATTESTEAFKNAQYIIIATPTDYNEETDSFNTSTIEKVMEDIIKINEEANVVIKSTIPVGYTEMLKSKYKKENIFFSPEFLREGKALKDNLFPSRIIVGSRKDYASDFAEMLKQTSMIPNEVEILYMENTEAESVKLFSNTYLALRISFFNEVDTFAEMNNLNSRDIILGMSLDPRIGNYYNNPSFGYGGYCLPKDTKQLYSNFGEISNSTIKASIEANEIRKDHIFRQVLSKNPSVIGIYRLTMKADSDNFRSSAIFSLIDKLIESGKRVIIYEPMYNFTEYEGIEVVNNLSYFAENVDLIVANRVDDKLSIYKDKVYTRDVFNEN